LLLRSFHGIRDPLPLSGGNHGSHLGLLGQRVAHPQGRRAPYEAFTEGVEDRPLHQDASTLDAGLTRRDEGCE